MLNQLETQEELKEGFFKNAILTLLLALGLNSAKANATIDKTNPKDTATISYTLNKKIPDSQKDTLQKTLAVKDKSTFEGTPLQIIDNLKKQGYSEENLQKAARIMAGYVLDPQYGGMVKVGSVRYKEIMKNYGNLPVF